MKQGIYTDLSYQIQNKKWMLYGAYGYTGELVIQESLSLGLKPILAGRSIGKLRPLAQKYDLPWRLLDLEDSQGLRVALEDVELVYHVAGPFVKTSAPMLEACLDTRTHYVDVTGEIPVVRNTFEHHEAAQEAGVVVISANGVNCVPTDCLASYLIERHKDTESLEIALDTVRVRSSGSLVSMLEISDIGGEVRRQGHIKHEPVAGRIKKVSFNHGQKTIVSLPLVDLETIYWHKKVPNITAYVAQPRMAAQFMKFSAPINKKLFANQNVRQKVQHFVQQHVSGPDQQERQKHRTYVWAEVKTTSGEKHTAWLESMEGYQLTAAIAPRAVCEILTRNWRGGAYSPAQAFGADFIVRMPSTLRFNKIK